MARGRVGYHGRGPISPDHGSILSRDFPGKGFGSRETKPFDPPAPEGVSEAFWRFAVARAHRKRGRGPYPAAGLGYMASGHHPAFTTETSPRRQPDWPY